MGVLDEAIRQHLELRRKHGATEDELERQEAEALGPARREPASQPPGDDSQASASGLAERTGESAGGGTVSESPADADADEVPAEEALEGGTPPPTGSAVEDSGHGRVFDVEELEPPDEPPVVRAVPSLDTETSFLDAEVVDEDVLDEEELAEEELADELAGGGLSEEGSPAPLLGDQEVDGPPDADRGPEPSTADDDDADEAAASFEEDTILRPPPPVDRGEADTSDGEADTSEYDTGELLPEDDELLEEEAVLADDDPLGDEDDMLLDEDDPLEEELTEEELTEEELTAPGELHVAADEDLDAEDDAEHDPSDTGPQASALPVSDEDAGEDVLEATPEFLQETPEHERLWFEQQPPRDFDLDR